MLQGILVLTKLEERYISFLDIDDYWLPLKKLRIRLLF